MFNSRLLQFIFNILLMLFLLLLADVHRASASLFGVSFEASCDVGVVFGNGSNHSDNGDSTGSIDLGCGGTGFAADFYGEGEDAMTMASSVTGGSIEIGSVGVQLATKALSTPSLTERTRTLASTRVGGTRSQSPVRP